MTAQDEIAIRGRLRALEFLFKFEVAERLKTWPDPVTAANAYKDLAIAALKVEAAMASNTDAAVYKAAVDATSTICSEVKELLAGSKST